MLFRSKWNVLKRLYGGAAGSTAIFNTWIELIQARLDDSAPLATQLAKLNETCVTLANANMGVTDQQYSLILLNALPASYEVVTTTILANASPSSLDYREITARILNEEGHRAGASGSSLNTAHTAPIKAKDKGKGRDHSNLTCHYCQKKGHIKPNCCKRKKDEAEQKKKEGNASRSGNKAANSHQLVPTTASIKEIDKDLVESFDNNSIGVALYAALRDRWMMDSGATHHITPHRSDFSDYTPCRGAVRLGDKSTISQVGVGSVVFTTSQGIPITLSNVLHLPEVKTRFISTRALAQKGVEVLFDSGSFKISV